jgi:hypothetical protein
MPDSIQNADTIDAQESGSESVSPEHPVTDINDPEKSTPDSELVGKVNPSSAMPPVSDGIEKSAHLPSLANSAAFKGPATMMAKALADFPDIAAMADIRRGTMAAFDSIDKSTLEKFVQLPSMTESVISTAAAAMAKIGAGLPDIAAMIDMRGGIAPACYSMDKSIYERLIHIAGPVIPELDIEKYSKMFSEIQNHMSARMDQVMARYTSATAQSLVKFSKTMEEMNVLAARAIETVPSLVILREEFETALMDLQWPAPMIRCGSALMQDIVDSYNRLPREEANVHVGRVLSQIYDASCLHERLNSWVRHEWIKRRISILAPAIEAHIRGQYELSVPTLVVQIEGILSGSFKEGEWVTQKHELAWIRTACENDGSVVGRLAASFFVSAFFQEFHVGQQVVPSLSRNAILHGTDLGYATAVNSLKMILLLDCTIYVLDEQMSAHDVLETRPALTS